MKKWVAYGLVLCLFVTIVPLLVISHYNVPLGDDFAHAIGTTHVWRETHSLWALIREAWHHVAEHYMLLQGRWVETFFVAIAPIVFNHHLNFVGPYISIFLFTGSQLFLSYVLFRKIIKGERYDWILIGIPMIILQILFICSPAEGIYWNAGAVAYTWGYSFGILATAAFLCLAFCREHLRLWKKVILSVLMIGSTVFFTGTNFMIGLTFLVIAFLLFLICIRYFKKNVILAAFWLGTGIVNFLIVVLAPGNSMRLSQVTGYPPLKSIFSAYVSAAEYTWYFLHLPMILMFLFMIPILWKPIGKMNYSFKYPLIALFLAFSVFASSMVPAYYGFGDLAPGPWRIRNVWKHLLFWVILFSVVYIIGWLQKQVKIQIKVQETDKRKKVFLVLAAFVCVGWSLYVMGPFEKLSSVSAIRSLRSGQAARYHQEWMERVEILEDEGIQNAVLKPFSDPPYVLFYYDGEIRAEQGENQHLVQFYDKESVELLSE